MAGLKLSDVSLDKRRAFVTGKGDKSRHVKFTHAPPRTWTATFVSAPSTRTRTCRSCGCRGRAGR
ncbi:hypothetical protein [Nocardiopsis oceani]